MGLRGQVAYTNGENVSIHYTHWGGDGQLVDELTRDTPFGGENDEPDYINGAICDLGSDAEGYLAQAQPPEQVEREPMYVCGNLQEWYDNIDAVPFEGAYLVDVFDWTVRAFKIVYVKNHPGTFRFIEIESADEWESVGRVFESIEEIETAYGDQIWTP